MPSGALGQNPTQFTVTANMLRCAAICCFAFLGISHSHVQAQTATLLHAFATLSGPLQTNLDGANPTGELLLLGNTLFGTASHGGTNGLGSIFALDATGAGFTNLYTFSAVSGPVGTNGDGAYPLAGLVLDGNFLYGTSSRGGASGAGTVFRLSTNGTGFTTLHSFSAPGGILFSNSDGAHPQAALVLSGTTLYGTAGDGGTSGNGTVFALASDGSSFKTLHNFPPAYASAIGYYTNLEGANPVGGLVLGNGTLFGTAVYGGKAGQGVLFGLGTNGGGFVNLHDFALPVKDSSGNYTNTDGANPTATLILSGGLLYGAAQNGGARGSGTCFSLGTSGSPMKTLHHFNPTTDGAAPVSSLVLSGQSLYGTAGSGTPAGQGAVFMLNVNGTGFTNLFSFPPLSNQTNAIGANPIAGLVYAGGAIYGATYDGGPLAAGSVYSLLLPAATQPVLSISRSDASVVLSWPSQASGLNLQAAPTLNPPVSWTNLNTAPVQVNGMNTVTNPMFGPGQFFRLSR